MTQRHRLAAIGLVLGYIFVSAVASANAFSIQTVEDLFDSCNAHEHAIAEGNDISVDKAMSALACRIFVQGFIAGHNTVLAWAHEKGTVAEATVKELTVYCVPPDATVGSAIAAFLNWAERNPQSWQSLAGMGVGWAFETAWPCAKSI